MTPQIVIDANVLIPALLSREAASFKLLQEEGDTVSATFKVARLAPQASLGASMAGRVSLNRFVATAPAETMSALMATEYLERRAAIASLLTSVFCLSLPYPHSAIRNCLTPHSVSREDS